MRTSKILFLVAIFAVMIAFLACSKSDSQNTNSQVVDNTPSKVVSLDVSGMTCTGCETNVKRALKKIDGVKDVKASFKKGSATVTINPDKVKEEQLIKALDDIGYPAKKNGES